MTQEWETVRDNAGLTDDEMMDFMRTLDSRRRSIASSRAVDIYPKVNLAKYADAETTDERKNTTPDGGIDYSPIDPVGDEVHIATVDKEHNHGTLYPGYEIENFETEGGCCAATCTKCTDIVED
jgi:hypothetical protein